MERRQLNLNAPLISVRRISSPSHSGELKKWKMIERPLPSRQQSLPPSLSGYEYEVTKPVAVPFHWEQFPGRPKGETTVHTPNEYSTTPKLPPGRLSEVRRYSGETPKLPPKRVAFASRYNSGERFSDYKSQVEAFSFIDHANLLEKLKESLKCNHESDSESGEDDEEYSDALDMLSPTASRSSNYSVSGLSGDQSSGAKPSGTFSIDTQTRDFMLNRFLPAAKAAVLETPQYAVKKPPVIKDQPEQPLKKAVSGERKPLLLERYGAVSLPSYGDRVISEGYEDKDLSSRFPVKKPGKLWGFLPRFCRKNPLYLLNQLPAMKSKTQSIPTHSTGDIRKLTRNAHSGPLEKKSYPVPQKKKFHSGLLTGDLPDLENKTSNDTAQIIDPLDSFKSGLSNLRRYRSGSVSPYRNETPKSPFREGSGFLGVPKQLEDRNATKIASSRKLFKALQDVSKSHIERETGPTEIPIPNNKVEDKETSILDEKKRISKFGYISYDEDSNSHKCKDDDKRDFEPSLLKSPLPPALPKSPSESWLWRTLPSISLGNPFSNSSRVHSRKECHKGYDSDTKWETIVKTTNIRHDHVRYSEELIPHRSHRRSK